MANILYDAFKNYYKQNASKLFQDYVNEGRVGTKHPEADPWSKAHCCPQNPRTFCKISFENQGQHSENAFHFFPQMPC